MMPGGTLNIEHRLIEKMIELADKELVKIKKTKRVNTVFIEAFADFIHIFVDLTHNGKEEEILFKGLQNKKISTNDSRMMQELLVEHINARIINEELIRANRDYIFGDSRGLDVIIEKLSFLTNFYPVHIRKEDEDFMPNAEKYFTEEELNKMLDDFLKFDAEMIREKYNKLYVSLSKNSYSIN